MSTPSGLPAVELSVKRSECSLSAQLNCARGKGKKKLDKRPVAGKEPGCLFYCILHTGFVPGSSGVYQMPLHMMDKACEPPAYSQPHTWPGLEGRTITTTTDITSTITNTTSQNCSSSNSHHYHHHHHHHHHHPHDLTMIQPPPPTTTTTTTTPPP